MTRHLRWPPALAAIAIGAALIHLGNQLRKEKQQ
jgi:ABC-type Fe3+-siderophore transport system permease subunit